MSSPLKLNGMVVDGFIAASSGKGGGVRVSADDWERLRLVPGQQVQIEGPGVGEKLLLVSADEAPPIVWAQFLPLSARFPG